MLNKRKREHTIICPHCFSICGTLEETGEYSLNSKSIDDFACSSIYRLGGICQECGEETDDFIVVDSKIAEVIMELNMKGYLTEFSCQGHYPTCPPGYYEDASDPYIFFVTPIYRKIKSFEKYLPKEWFIDKDDFAEGHLIIRAKMPEDSNEEPYDVDELLEWVYKLPRVQTKFNENDVDVLIDLKEYVEDDKEDDDSVEEETIGEIIHKIIEEDKENIFKEILCRKADSITKDLEEPVVTPDISKSTCPYREKYSNMNKDHSADEKSSEDLKDRVIRYGTIELDKDLSIPTEMRCKIIKSRSFEDTIKETFDILKSIGIFTDTESKDDDKCRFKKSVYEKEVDEYLKSIGVIVIPEDKKE